MITKQIGVDCALYWVTVDGFRAVQPATLDDQTCARCVPTAQGVEAEPVGYVSQGVLELLDLGASGHGFIYPEQSEEHPHALYASPPPAQQAEDHATIARQAERIAGLGAELAECKRDLAAAQHEAAHAADIDAQRRAELSEARRDLAAEKEATKPIALENIALKRDLAAAQQQISTCYTQDDPAWCAAQERIIAAETERDAAQQQAAAWKDVAETVADEIARSLDECAACAKSCRHMKDGKCGTRSTIGSCVYAIRKTLGAALPPPDAVHPDPRDPEVQPTPPTPAATCGTCEHYGVTCCNCPATTTNYTVPTSKACSHYTARAGKGE